MMEWNIIRFNPNSRTIESYNILRGIEKDLAKIKKKAKDKRDFGILLDSEIMYHFWSRCEWEILVSAWPPSKNEKVRDKETFKIDVYQQLKLNWNKFVDYCWNYEYKEK